MQRRPLFWLVLSLLCLGGAIYFWKLGDESQAGKNARRAAESEAKTSATPAARPLVPVSTQPTAKSSPRASTPFPYRLSNTDKSLKQLIRDDKAIILENALIDTANPLTAIPEHLRAPKNNDSYIVQARGPVDDRFRARLSGANAAIVSYIPNNAYLVRVSSTGAQALSADPLVQSVLPYEPYYKVESSLLEMAVKQQDLPGDVTLSVTLFPDARETVLNAMKQLGADVVGEDRSPFGTVLTVHPAKNTFNDLVLLPGVQGVARSHIRQSANDLTRQTLGISVNSTTNGSNYLNLSGSNVMVSIIDSGVDATHPDLSGRIFPPDSTDSNGHGTHVAGTILGNGSQSSTVGTNASGSVLGASFQGMATNASAFVIPIAMATRPGADDGFPPSDSFVQEQAALQGQATSTNALIANNSWNYVGAAGYDIAAASYDAAVRDALPAVTGPQPLLLVFSAGNGGGGSDDGSGGNADTIFSPGTAKNVITVGAIEQNRNITNSVVLDGSTNQSFLPGTDSSNQVASFSSRGNVGIGIEGDAGRFKPDVIAPGTYVISDRPIGTNWDTVGYYNPTNFTFNTFFNQVVETNSLTGFSVFIPDNAVQLIVTVVTNDLSSSPFPPMPIYARLNDIPTLTTFDLLATNSISIPTNSVPLSPGSTVFFGVGNSTNQLVHFDFQTELVTTNDSGTFLTVLSNLNDSLGGFYRYESGTSMSAAGVSGMLALIQEFFQSRLQTNASPALMKALLINGARPVSQQYDFQVANSINFQGWGLPNLSNSIPGVLTNATKAALPVQFFDQDPNNALATGQSKTRNLTFTTSGGAQNARITLVWTDPPGNPAAGIKLVNDLDLIVSNLDDPNNVLVFYGNDIPAGSDFNEPANTNGPPPADFVNNVENVYLPPPQGTNYSVTVYARRVNVNAVTSNTNNVVQDYALVISCGDGGVVSNAFTLTDVAPVSSSLTNLTTLTNGIPLLNQRVGANPQYASTTNGFTNQWNFYVFTNTEAATDPNFTNVAFVTFQPPNLGLPRGGTVNGVAPPDTNATRVAGADIDLYVSTDPSLTNLNPAAIAAAFKSTTRTGTEKVLFTNSTPNQVFYIGVKSEDQQGAEFGFVAVATTNSFGQRDPNGNVILTVLTPLLPAPIVPGSPSKPGVLSVLALTTEEVQARKVVVIDSVTHQEFGDLIGSFSHAQKFAVLNNHSFFDNGLNTEAFTYDDSGELDPLFPGARHTDGPGSLQSFIGDQASEGIWILSMVNDSSLSDTGTVNSLTGIVVPHSPTGITNATIPADSWLYDFIDVPPGVTNLTVTVTIAGATPGPVDVFLRRGAVPTQSAFDKAAVINPPGGTLTLTSFESPPLNPGRYFIGIFNPNAAPVQISANWVFGSSPTGAQVFNFLSAGNEPIPDDAITDSINHVSIASKVVSAEVGVRIDHPRESDLVLTLVSPSGTRVLLAENRGGLDTNGYGSGTNIINNFAPTTSGDANAATSSILINSANNAGTLIINYNMETVPDDMRVYYDGVRIFDSGFVSGAGTFSIDFGPGVSTNVIVVMNENGNPNNSTVWNYSATVVTKSISYVTFTEDTNKTTLPIKFAVPPFGGGAAFSVPVTIMTSSFESNAAGDYPTLVDGWAVTSTNPVTVVTVPALTASEGNPLAGTNVLALHKGTISQILPTIAGRSYTLSFAKHGRPVVGPVSWWKAENTPLDAMGNNNGVLVSAGPTPYAPGEVGEAFNFSSTVSNFVRIQDMSTLIQSNGFSFETWIKPTLLPAGSSLIFGQLNGSFAMFTTNVGGALSLGVQIVGPPGFGTTNTVAGNLIGQFDHVAATWDGTNLSIYINGVLAAGPFLAPPGTTPTDNGTPFYIGGTPGQLFFDGLIDESAYYSNALSTLQIQDIYAAGSAGKCLGGCAAAARVILNGVTNPVITAFDAWTTNVYSFIAPSNNVALTIQSLQDGLLLDSFQLVENPAPNTNNFYLPEESLTKLVGEKSDGDWTLEVLDNRAGATANPTPNLVSWQLSLILEATVPATIPLSHGVTQTNSVPPGGIAYFSVSVPSWASFATNMLFNVTGGTVDLLFNQNVLPGTNAQDVILIPSGIGGTVTLSGPSIPPLLPGNTYFLGVRNTGPTTVSFNIEVDFDITPLFNAVPLMSTLAPISTLPHYYYYDVSSNAIAVSFEILNPSGNVDLVARQGSPLPDTNSFDYKSANPGTNNETIVVASNSTPVILTPGRWFLGVFNNDVVPVTYTIEAVEVDPPSPTVIPLTNDEVFTTNFPPGPALFTFFSFTITNSPSSALFELYNLNGNVDLTADLNTFPFAPPFIGSSLNPGTNGEQVVLRTNQLGTNINGTWFLGVPNNDSSNVTFTIHAVVETNGMLISKIPITVIVSFTGSPATNGLTFTWPSIPGETYEVQDTTDFTTWTPIALINATGPTISYTDPRPLNSAPQRFYRIVQVPVGTVVPINVVISVTPGPSITLTWNSLLNDQYEVDSSPDTVNWTPLTVPPITATGTTTSYTDPNPIGPGPTFYRVLQLP